MRPRAFARISGIDESEEYLAVRASRFRSPWNSSGRNLAVDRADATNSAMSEARGLDPTAWLEKKKVALTGTVSNTLMGISNTAEELFAWQARALRVVAWSAGGSH